MAKLVPGRTDVQCRERYKNCLDPNVNMQQFTAEEDAALEAAVAAHLAQSPEAAIPWSAIAKLLPGRTDSQVAKRWKAAIQAQSWRGKGGRQQSQPAEATPVASRGKKRGRKKGSTLPSPSKEEVPLVAGVSRSGRKVIRPASLAAYDDPDGGSLPWKALAAATAAATEAEEDGDEQCGACRGASEGRAGGDALWVGCDACSTWYHADCVGMTKADVDAVRDSPWYCASCRQ